MAVRDILQLGNPILYQAARVVDDPHDAGVQQTIKDLSDTLRAFREEHGFGRGIAAPQIGSLLRVIYIRMPDNSFDGPLINPVITHRSSESIEYWDSCFSFADLLVRVRRAQSITVRYVDGDGAEQSLEATDDLSELLQHEIDHLEGILATQRAVSDQALMTRVEWERQNSPGH
jgi:peptide deformylase